MKSARFASCSIGVWLAVAATCGTIAGRADDLLADRIGKVIDAPEYKHAHWGILIEDLAEGETVYALNADKLFAPASTTKLFSVAAALDELGADYRFETPLYTRGEVDADGELDGDLVLVASGDLSLGGRTILEDDSTGGGDGATNDQSGRIAFKNYDHTYADFSPSAEITDTDPTAGLRALARQVAEAGIRRVRGDVLIDDRLFDTARGSGSGPSLLTPIMVNDNLIDLVVTPAKVGSRAEVVCRPQTTAWSIDAQVKTVAADLELRITVSSPGDRRIVVRGQVPAGRKPLVRIFAVEEPATFARALLIEVLERQGVTVAASPLSANRPDALPGRDAYAELRRVATLKSPRFAESAKLILKVSHNLHASTLPLLLAARHGERTLEQGLRRQHDFLARAGVDVESISFGGAAGGDRADYVTPRAAVQLLRHMTTRDDFTDYLAALPILGVDGTLVTAVDDNSPARGQVQAKTGTLLWHNSMNARYLLTSKALAGYLTTAGDRRLVFALYVNNVHLASSADAARIGRELGRLCEIIHQFGDSSAER